MFYYITPAFQVRKIRHQVMSQDRISRNVADYPMYRGVVFKTATSYALSHF